jgi:hypothetical protein
MKTRQIAIDIDVYRTIESERATFEETSNDILRRLLGLSARLPESYRLEAKSTYSDYPGLAGRGKDLPNNLELQATHKGTNVLAVVNNGVITFGGKRFDTPSAAAIEVTGYNVNGWRFWRFYSPTLQRWVPLDQLRKPGIESGECFLEEIPILSAHVEPESIANSPTETEATERRLGEMTSRKKPWKEIVYEALTTLGGVADLQTIYHEIHRVKVGTLSKQWQATVRNTLETYSKDSFNFKGEDIFWSVEGKHKGVWGLAKNRR